VIGGTNKNLKNQSESDVRPSLSIEDEIRELAQGERKVSRKLIVGRVDRCRDVRTTIEVSETPGKRQVGNSFTKGEKGGRPGRTSPYTETSAISADLYYSRREKESLTEGRWISGNRGWKSDRNLTVCLREKRSLARMLANDRPTGRKGAFNPWGW